jgi:hypothetical protein
LDILSAILATGIPGFFTYVYLSKTGVLKYDKDEKDDKVIVLSIFSILNMCFTYYIYRIVTKVDPLTEMNWKNAPYIFVLGIFVTFAMTNFYKFLLEKYNKKFEKKQRSNNKIILSKKSIYEKTLVKENKTKPFIYIFDFENKFIESGYFYLLDDKESKISLGLCNNTCYIEEPPKFEEIIKAFNEEEDTNKKDLIVDFERKIKIFIFHLD